MVMRWGKLGTQEKSSLRELLNSLLAPMAVLTVFCWGITLFWGFDVSTLAGFAIGFGYVWLCYVYLARSCERAVELDIKKGKRVMLTCYAIRYSGLFSLCAFSMLTGYINVIGILVPQFFPRIVLTAKEFFIKKKGSD